MRQVSFNIPGSQVTRIRYYLDANGANYSVSCLDAETYLNRLSVELPENNSEQFEVIRDLTANIAESVGLDEVVLVYESEVAAGQEDSSKIQVRQIEKIIDLGCSCGRHIYSVYEYAENELGLWYNCPACQTTGLVPVDSAGLIPVRGGVK